ncbi:MAG TPA: DNA replication/repair protein RecF [Candidatus Limosilactobacillus merdipullorum]|uniref:DNA replication and repair protein RecF n=1 Tax=Candidatus Limosilactobacillus merdipullorum TaxID=2838653 RepID=A0A9D1U2L5_9LACO|nr:DNA replication/repair protein RecF [Candidatus Limosilactobacillus merdipullorum]
MILEELKLHHFRNYEDLTVKFHPGINVLIGENAQGKTNLLEAIYVLALTKSHRTANDRELISWNEHEASVAGRVKKKLGSLPLAVQFSSRGKRVRMNHLFQPRLSSYIGALNVVLFAPEDLELVKGAPVVRRQFMDTEFSQMSNQYLFALGKYNQVLKQRNQYLKQLKYHQQSDKVLLGVLSEELAQSGGTVIALRYQLLKQLEVWAQELHQHISTQKETLKFKYVSQVETTDEKAAADYQQELLAQYQQRAEHEIELGTTLTGPHRDDVAFLVNGQNVQSFGSQGQQRTTALSVKLAEIELMKQQTNEYPLLLLDDVLSELDNDRQTHLLTAIQDKVQTFLTTTSLSGVARQLINQPAIYHIEYGQISEEETQ